MIKTYKARVHRNNVSYLLYGKQGNEVRFNFTDGNININKGIFTLLMRSLRTSTTASIRSARLSPQL